MIFYREGETVLFDQWLKTLPLKVQAKCLSQVRLLRSQGHELRRPIADFLRDGIYELRASSQGVHYRMLYFFCGKAVVVVSHGLAKEREVPSREIDRAIWRKKQVEADLRGHTIES